MAALKIAFVFLIAACVFALAAPKTRKELEDIRKNCYTENNVTDEMYKIGTESGPGAVDKVDEKYKCYLKCTFINSDLMTSEGKFLRYPLEEDVNRGKMQSAMDSCASVKGNNICDTAYLFQKCLIDKLDKMKRTPN